MHYSKIYQNVVLEQKKRVKAQDRRFRLGRVSVNELVVAEDDLGSWQFQNQQKAAVELLLTPVAAAAATTVAVMATSTQGLL